MPETNDIVRSSGSPDSSKRERGMNRIWATLHPRQVIWFLLSALIAGMIFVGNGYRGRLVAVEKHIEIQNGTLTDMKLEQNTQRINMEWVVRSMGGTPAVTPPKEEEE